MAGNAAADPMSHESLLANSSEGWVNWRQRPAQTEEHEHR
jgi:predicted metal-binding protein